MSYLKYTIDIDMILFTDYIARSLLMIESQFISAIKCILIKTTNSFLV